ncbi:MAG: hypothetical protein WBA10_03185 [Elainellaceae cyanobacterium]
MDVPFSSRSDSCFYISGDVQVHPSAAIAFGVFLQADPGSRLVVGPSVSIGSGAVLHAQGGVLSIATQVTLGTGVLLMGYGRIGAGACIGANSTLLAKVDVAQGQLIDADTILGEQALFCAPADPKDQASEVANTASSALPNQPSEAEPSVPGAEPSEAKPSEAKPQPIQRTEVYGKIVVERLMRMMSSP